MKLMICIDPELLFTDCDDDDDDDDNDDDDLQSAGLKHLDSCNLNNPPLYEDFIIELIRSDQNRSDVIVNQPHVAFSEEEEEDEEAGQETSASAAAR